MPLVLDPGAGDAIGLDELVEALEATPFDAADEASLASLGPLLARLGRNRHFLSDLAIDELKTRCQGLSARNGYGPQVVLLRPPSARYVLRANFWPARDDPVVRASGTDAFFYDLPHDHNFSFLTFGYLGPGYWSDYYDYDRAAVVGLPGERAGMRFVERARLEPGKLMLYRRQRDIHVQLPADSLSVSLNILASDPAQLWIDQYRFDPSTDTVAGVLSTTPAEALVMLAAHFGGGNGVDLADHFARGHPCERMRVTAIDALASAAPSDDARATILECAAGAASAYVSGHARVRLAAFAARPEMTP